MTQKALITWGGWDGHTPKETAQVFAEALEKKGFQVSVENSLESWADVDYLKTFNLIIPVWTMGSIEKEQVQGLTRAVAEHGVGLAGVHGGMGDAFRGQINYEWMVGGIFVGHPHVGDYTVIKTEQSSPITEALPEAFPYKSEQYYMLVDPGNRVLAETIYTLKDGQRVRMPVVWTRQWGKGRVFYSALGHRYEEFHDFPHVLDMTVKGFLWATHLL